MRRADWRCGQRVAAVLGPASGVRAITDTAIAARPAARICGGGTSAEGHDSGAANLCHDGHVTPA